jgi:gliding motility-associated-like protein
LSGASGGNHTILVTDAVGCTVTATVNVGMTNLPVVNDNTLNVVDATCGNANGSISGLSITGSAPFTYVWMGTASTTLDIYNLTAGNYSLTVTDALGCSSTPYATVVNGAGAPNADFTYTSGVIVPGSTVDFNDASTGTAINSWEWSINSAAPFATSQNTSFLFANEGEYTVTLVIETAEGCIDSITKLITIYGEIIIPNVITVNGDQMNDVFDIVNLKPNTTLIIQNRWGNVVFATEDYLNNWKGTDQLGNQLVEGTYFYQIITVEGNTWKGFVQLINKD